MDVWRDRQCNSIRESFIFKNWWENLSTYQKSPLQLSIYLFIMQRDSRHWFLMEAERDKKVYKAFRGGGRGLGRGLKRGREGLKVGCENSSAAIWEFSYSVLVRSAESNFFYWLNTIVFLNSLLITELLLFFYCFSGWPCTYWNAIALVGFIDCSWFSVAWTLIIISFFAIAQCTDFKMAVAGESRKQLTFTHQRWVSGIDTEFK